MLTKLIDFRWAMPLLTALCLAACNSGSDSASAQGGGAQSPLPNAEPPQLAAATEQPILVQGDFESGSNAWISCGISGGIGLTSDTTFGANALRLSEDNNCVYQNMAVLPGASLQLSCEAKRTGVGSAAMSFGYVGNANESIDTKEIEILDPEFSPATIELNTPANAVFVKVAALTSGDAVLTLDDCKITPITSNSILTSNPAPEGSSPTLQSIKSKESFGTDTADMDQTDLIDWKKAWMSHDSRNVWLAWETHNDVNTALWGLAAYIDFDQNRNTGFTGFNDEYPIGVDTLLEGTELYRYSGNGTDWSWRLVDTNGEVDVGNTALRNISREHLGDDFTGSILVGGGYIDTYNTIDVFFRGDNTAAGGSGIDYYPDAVTDPVKPPSARYFSYDMGTIAQDLFVDTTPVVYAPTGIDVRNNMKGPDQWFSGPEVNQITVTNTGDSILSNMFVENNNLPDCSFYYPTLAPGESKSETCPPSDSEQSVHTHAVIVTAFEPDGTMVTDSDKTTSVRNLSPVSSQDIFATPDKYKAQSGDTITFTVEVANNGNISDSDVSSVTSSLASCNRQFNPPVTVGEFQSYTCVASNIQVPFNAEFTTDGNATRTVEILPPGTESIDVKYGLEGDDVNALTVSSGDLIKDVQPVSVSITVANNNAYDMTNVEVIHPGNPSCDKTYSLIYQESRRTHKCISYFTARGQILSDTVTATGERPDGTIATDSDSHTTYREQDLKLDMQIGPADQVIYADPGSPVLTTISFSNRGHIPITSVESLTLTATDVSDATDCEILLSSLVSQGLSLLPGETVQHDCSFTFPGQQFLSDFNDISRFTIDASYSSNAIDDLVFNSTATADLQIDRAQVQPDNASLLVYTDSITDIATISSTSVDRNRVQQLLENGDFESVDIDGVPTGWTSDDCSGSVAASTLNGSQSVELDFNACLTYYLQADEMAILSGKKYVLTCMTPGNGSDTTIITYLNGSRKDAKRNGVQFPATLISDAPPIVTDGFVRIYAREGVANIDNCELSVLGPIGNDASIKVSNHIEGGDAYQTYDPFEYQISVNNDGNEPLSDVQIYSDKLNCDVGFASLAVNETVTFVCASNTPIFHWDDVFSHHVTATALTSSGQIVADIDYASHGGAGFSASRPAGDIIINSGASATSSATVATGDNLDLTVQIVMGNNASSQLVTAYELNPDGSVNTNKPIDSCNRSINPVMEQGDTISYSCSVENILEDTQVLFRVIPLKGARETRTVLAIHVE